MGDIDDLIAERERLRDELRVQSQPIVDKISALTAEIREARRLEAKKRSQIKKGHKVQSYRDYLENKYVKHGGLLAYLSKKRMTWCEPEDWEPGGCSVYYLNYWFKKECKSAGVAYIVSIDRCLRNGMIEIFGLHFCENHAKEIYSDGEPSTIGSAPDDPPR